MSLVFSKEVKDSNGRSKYLYKSKLFVRIVLSGCTGWIYARSSETPVVFIWVTRLLSHHFYASVMATVVAGDRTLLSCPYFYESACLSAAPILNLISLEHLEGILSNRTIHCDLGHNAEYD